MSAYYNPDYRTDRAIGVAQGGLGLLNNFLSMNNQSLNLPSVPTQSFSPYERPTYNLGQSYNMTSVSKPQGASGGEILSGVGQGASAGASFGLPGMAIGGVLGGLTSLIGGAFRKDKQQEEKRKQEDRLVAGQKSFNTATDNFIKGQNLREDYIDQTTRYQNNLYS